MTRLNPLASWQMFCMTMLIILVGCVNEQKPLDTAPDFVGFISQVMPGDGSNQTGQIIVESQANKVVKKVTTKP